MNRPILLLFFMPALVRAEGTPSLDTVGFEGALLKMLLTLGGLLLLVLLTFWVLRKIHRGSWSVKGGSQKIVILEKKPLSPKSLLYLVEVDKKRVLISESQLEVRMFMPRQEEDPYQE